MKEALDSAMKLTSELKRLHSENSELSAWASTEAKLRSDIGKFKNFAVELKHENERLRARVVLLTEEVREGEGGGAKGSNLHRTAN